MAAINEFKRGDIVDVDRKILRRGVIVNVEKSSGLYEVKLTLDNDDKTTGIFCKASEMILKWRFVSTWNELKEYAEANLQGKIVAIESNIGRNYKQGDEFQVDILIGRANLIVFYSDDSRLSGGSDGHHKTLKYGYNISSTSFNEKFKIYVVPKIDAEREKVKDIRSCKVKYLGENDYIRVLSVAQLEMIHNIAKIPFDKIAHDFESSRSYDCFCIRTNKRKQFLDVAGSSRIIEFLDFLKDNPETGSGIEPTSNKQKYLNELQGIPISVRHEELVDDTFNVLPEKWKLRVDKYEIKDFVNKYRTLSLAGWSDDDYIFSDLLGSNKNSWKYVRGSGGSLEEFPSHKEITFDQFKQYVKDNFLPKSWCIRITKTNISIIRGWIEIPTIHLGLYLGVCENKGLGIFTDSEAFSAHILGSISNLRAHNMTQISLQEFQKHVLKTEIRQTTNDNTVNSIAINSKLYNSNLTQFKQPENGKIAIVQISNLEITAGNPVRGIGLESPRSEIIVGNHSIDYKKRSSSSKKGVLKDTIGMSLRYPI